MVHHLQHMHVINQEINGEGPFSNIRNECGEKRQDELNERYRIVEGKNCKTPADTGFHVVSWGIQPGLQGQMRCG